MIGALSIVTPLLAAMVDFSSSSMDERIRRAVLLKRYGLVFEGLSEEEVLTFLRRMAEWTAEAFDLEEMQRRLDLALVFLHEAPLDHPTPSDFWHEPADFVTLNSCEEKVGVHPRTFGGMDIVTFDQTDLTVIEKWNELHEDTDKAYVVLRTLLACAKRGVTLLDINQATASEFGVWPDVVFSWDPERLLVMEFGSEGGATVICRRDAFPSPKDAVFRAVTGWGSLESATRTISMSSAPRKTVRTSRTKALAKTVEGVKILDELEAFVKVKISRS